MKRLLFSVVFTAILSTAGGDEIWGTVTGVDAEEGVMEVSGVTIIAKSAVVRGIDRLPMTLSRLKKGRFARVRGTFSAPGAMIATEIMEMPFERARIIGTITAVNSIERTITIGGIKIKVPVQARLRDESCIGTVFGKNLIGRRAECRGYWSATRDFIAGRIRLF